MTEEEILDKLFGKEEWPYDETYPRTTLLECMKLAREAEQEKIFKAIDNCKYYIVFDDAWEKFKNEYKKEGEQS